MSGLKLTMPWVRARRHGLPAALSPSGAVIPLITDTNARCVQPKWAVPDVSAATRRTTQSRRRALDRYNYERIGESSTLAIWQTGSGAIPVETRLTDRGSTNIPYCAYHLLFGRAVTSFFAYQTSLSAFEPSL
jgi:hypothetical protein